MATFTVALATDINERLVVMNDEELSPE